MNLEVGAMVSFDTVKGNPVICPKCGAEYAGKGTWGPRGLEIFGYDEKINGTYCMRCYAEWLSQNVPRCLPGEATDKEGGKG